MSISKEVIAEIRDFHPGEKRTRPAVELGHIDSKTRLVYGVFPYQRRAVYIKGEPLVLAWTEQPVLALVNGKGFKTLAYTADVEDAGEIVAAKIANHLRFRTRPFVEAVEGQEDY